MCKNLFQLTIVLALLSLLAAACGQAEDAETEVGDTSSPSDTTAPPAPGDDEALGAGPFPIADLTIEVILDPAQAPVTSRLACLGDTATVTGADQPPAQQACLALNDDAVRALLLDGPADDRICTQEYGGPEVATISGTLDGEAVNASVDRADGCGIGDWNTLRALLPAV